MTRRDEEVANPERTKVNEPEGEPEKDEDAHETKQRHDDRPWPAVARDVKGAVD